MHARALPHLAPIDSDPLAAITDDDARETRILVVDDDHETLALLAGIVADTGHDVRAVGSAREARALLAREPFALLLSEASMSGETGLDLLHFTMCKHPRTATLLISAREDAAIAHAAMQFGACGYLSKPVNRAAVMLSVMSALRGRAQAAGEQAARVTLERALELRTHELSLALGRLEHMTEDSRVRHADTIERWAVAAEFGEPDVNGHLVRMSQYCGLLARKLGIHAESIQLASMLHDVGKAAMPDSIRFKRTPLTRDEWLAMETHTTTGHEMLRDCSSSVLQLAASIALSHHERVDGCGYPRGLSGNAIPFEGRIAAVADVFDALTSDAILRKAWTPPSAVAWITRQRGKHFDPDVVDALTSSIDEVLAIRAACTGRAVRRCAAPERDRPSAQSRAALLASHSWT
ncbi:MAG: HD domain-containing phosphohydrolase [Thermoleophilia bacterium]